jgi:hypothetical protein
VSAESVETKTEPPYWPEAPSEEFDPDPIIGLGSAATGAIVGLLVGFGASETSTLAMIVELGGGAVIGESLFVFGSEFYRNLRYHIDKWLVVKRAVSNFERDYKNGWYRSGDDGDSGPDIDPLV